MAKISKMQFVKGVVWKTLEQFSARGAAFLMSLILARLLHPDDYGLLALTGVFFQFANILVDGGFGTALVQKKDADEYDYSSVMVISMSIAAVLYAVIFAAAPFIADYYAEPELTAVMRISGLSLLISAYAAKRSAYITRNLMFKLAFTCNIIATIASGLLSIAAAYFGAGVWALVVHNLAQQLIGTVLVVILLKWNCRICFKWERVREMLRFSVGVVTASFVNYFSTSLYNLVIGKKYSVEDLGYYSKGGEFPMQVSLYTFGTISSVLLPTIASHKDDMEKVKRIIRRVVGVTSFLISPLMVGLAVTAPEAVEVLYTAKWLPIVPVLQSNCLYYLATPFMLINVQVFFALGHSAMRLKTEIIRMVMMIGGLLVFAFVFDFNINQLAWVCAVVTTLHAWITFLELKKMVPYKTKEFLVDFVLPLFWAVVMGAAVDFLRAFGLPAVGIDGVFVKLIIEVVAGMALYAAFAVVFKLSGYREMMDIIREMRGRKAKKEE